MEVVLIWHQNTRFDANSCPLDQTQSVVSVIKTLKVQVFKVLEFCFTSEYLTPELFNKTFKSFKTNPQGLCSIKNSLSTGKTELIKGEIQSSVSAVAVVYPWCFLAHLL